MLVSLRIGSPGEARASDAFTLLLECHDRIRRHSAIAEALVTRVDAPTAQRSEAAAQLVRYFGTALPLHVEDEDGSLAPRLRGHPLEAGEERWIATMTEQHERIEALLASLLPVWKDLSASNAAHYDLDSTREGTRELTALLEAHLSLEETHLFPLARKLLTPADVEAIAAEIRGRRSH